MVDPIYVLVVNDADITTKLYENSASLTYTETDGDTSDTLNMTIAGEWDMVKFTDKCKLYLGYASTEVWECGTFEVQSINISPFQMTVQATATSFNNRIKEKRDKTYKNKSIQNIVSEIAGRHSLRINCNVTETLKYIEQGDESDMHFLTRLSKEHNAIFKIKEDTLIFIKRDITKTHNIEISECSDFSITLKNRTIYKMSAVEYHESKENRPITVTAGSGTPVLKIKEIFESKEEAKRVAEKKLEEATRGTVIGSLSIYGINIEAGDKLKLQGDDRLQDKFTIKKVTHNISGGGFSTSLEFEN